MDEQTRQGMIRWVVKLVIFATLVGALLFLTAGDWGWGKGWLYLGIFLFQQVVTVLLVPAELLSERSQQQEGTKSWDKILALFAALLLPFAVYAVAGLDHRYGWTIGLVGWIWLLSLVVMVLGIVLTVWAMRANAFFSGTVRIQEDRGHTVVTGGPYRWVRHPGYVGAILHHVAAPLMLGSLWALIPGVLGALAMVLRTALEDRTLQEELEGYGEYAAQTRYRLIPGLW